MRNLAPCMFAYNQKTSYCDLNWPVNANQNQKPILKKGMMCFDYMTNHSPSSKYTVPKQSMVWVPLMSANLVLPQGMALSQSQWDKSEYGYSCLEHFIDVRYQIRYSQIITSSCLPLLMGHCLMTYQDNQADYYSMAPHEEHSLVSSI